MLTANRARLFGVTHIHGYYFPRVSTSLCKIGETCEEQAPSISLQHWCRLHWKCGSHWQDKAVTNQTVRLWVCKVTLLCVGALYKGAVRRRKGTGGPCCVPSS